MSEKKCPYLTIVQALGPAVKAQTWKSHSMACFLCLIPLLTVTSSVNSGPFLSAGKGVLRYSVPKWLTVS